jgi:large subunit ribosomal protein L47
MLTLLRHTRCSAPRFTRSFAEVASVSTSQNSKFIPPTPPLQPTDAGAVSTESSSPQSVAPIRLGNRVPVKADHGLYGFFRKKVPEKADEVFEGEARYETLGGSIYGERTQSGMAPTCGSFSYKH